MPAPHESDSRRLHEVEDADEGSPHDAEDGRDAVGGEGLNGGLGGWHPLPIEIVMCITKCIGFFWLDWGY